MKAICVLTIIILLKCKTIIIVHQLANVWCASYAALSGLI
jgi:hypothetical protein